MNKNNTLQLILVIGLFLVSCAQQGGEIPVLESESVPAVNDVVTPESDQVDEANETNSDNAQAAEDLAGPEVFVPITVEDFGISTLVPADWPAIEGDPLLKNAWGPGEYRFVAFHSVPGEDLSTAMAQLLGISVDELLEGPPEGEYWEEQIGSYEWAMYTVDNPDIGIGQSVSMTEQNGIIYIVSLFIELDYRQAVLNAVIENFDISSAAALVEGEISAEPAAEVQDEATPEVEEEATSAESDLADIELLDTPWLLTQIADNSGQLLDALADVQATAVFKENERVSGSAGCNDYVSNYTLEDEAMTVSVPAMTRKNCAEPEDIMLQETNYVNNLTAVTRYQIEGQELQLLDSDGNAILIFSIP